MLGIGDKVLAMVGGGLSLVLGAALVFTVISKNGEIRALDKSINDPETGYAVKLERAQRDLAQCRANRITLEDAANRQSEAVAEAERRADARLAALGRSLGASAEELRRANARAADILERVPDDDECAAALELAREPGQ